MEYINNPLFASPLSRIALGTWAIGGSLWGGTSEDESIATILEALDLGINVLDTAPAYGNGVSEKYVGKAIKKFGDRSKVILSTKCGIEFRADGSAVRNLTKAFMLEDFHNSLKRLGTDYIDIYYIHWPDPLAPLDQSAEVMEDLHRQGKIRTIGLSNFTVDLIKSFRKIAPCHWVQPPYNLFERNIEADLLPYCKKEKTLLMTYSVLCRGLLSGKMSRKRHFEGDDLRKNIDPKFKPPVFDEYLLAAKKLSELAQKKYGKTLLEFAIRWVLDQGSDIAIWGARRPDQLQPIEGAFGWHLDQASRKEVDDILRMAIKHPQDVTTYMGPPTRTASAA